MEVMRAAVAQMGDPSCVAEARRVSAELLGRLAWNEEMRGRAAILVTELATNLLKHARNGKLVFNGFSDDDGSLLQAVAVDQGPGISDINRCLADGFSTAGSPGTGLGAVRRFATAFDVYSTPGKGTVMLAEIDNRKAQAPPAATGFQLGGLCVQKEGEIACGDAWDVQVHGGRMALIVVDGLGHGGIAAEAATAALKSFRSRPFDAPADTLARLHQDLRATRGAAAIVALLDPGEGLLRYAGIGNVAGVLVNGAASRHLVSHNGTLGHTLSRVAHFDYPFGPGSALVVHTDGVSARWRPDEWPGVWARHPGLAAGALFRDHVRGRDDATVLAVRAEDV